MTDSEVSYLANWLRPREFGLFEAMPRADQRHGLDVMQAMRAAGATDRDLLVAGLLHDCGKGRGVFLAHRVAWALGQRYGEWIWKVCGPIPTFRRGLRQLRYHAEVSARMADEAGCSPRTVDLIRQQENPLDEDGQILHDADEAC